MKYIALVLFVFIATISNAQKFSGGINFQLGFPQGEYKMANSKTGLGGRLNFLYKPQEKIPVSFGVDFGYQVIGSRSSRFGSSYYGFYDEYRVSANNNILSLMLNLRIDPLPKDAAVRPFVDGLFGWNDFFSTVTIERITYNNYNGAQTGESSKARWAAAYGGSVGLDIRLDKRDKIYLQVKTSYLAGANSKYLTDPVINNNGSVSFIERESKTNMLIPQIGVRAYL